MGKILVVDDDADTREMIRRRLTEAGHHVLLLANGQAAYQATVAHKPDAVVVGRGHAGDRRNGGIEKAEIRLGRCWDTGDYANRPR